ncbi:MAG: hypothetical protein LBH01_10865 [Verrucomicrobiales bacterium]|jgi:hypothetical protein|nr:hypothetical protein [Verrucomicrobiales bacterium]
MPELLERTNVINIPAEEMDGYFNILDQRSRGDSGADVSFLSLAGKVLKIENHVPSLAPIIRQNFGFCLRDSASHSDALLRVWESEVASLVADFAANSKSVFLSSGAIPAPEISLFLEDNRLEAHHQRTSTFHYAGRAFSNESLAQAGHLFVRLINQVAKGPGQALVHAAAVGLDDKGVLICARGGGGKSTLAISSMLAGFQYVADDYLILEQRDRLYANPIYSVITLSPEMRRRMPSLQAEFLWDNYNKKKQVLGISAHHSSFARELPIKAVIFPNISHTDACTIEHANKGKAITQLVHSTVSQMGDQKDPSHLKTLISFVKDLDFYQINLGTDLHANVSVLAKFIKGIN